MKSIRARIRKGLSDEGGLTLIEVLVSLMIFAIVAVGVAYSLASIVTLTRDARSREVAVNLAAEMIDSSRSIEDVFDVVTTPGGLPTDVRTVAGVKYQIYRDAEWVTSTNEDAQCGAAAGATAGSPFAFKRINVTVTWDGMRPGSTPVRSDTLISPNERINDPTRGTILVSVQLASGIGASGLAVTATPVAGGGGAAITVPILPTDVQGCSYILKVVPGEYVVSLTKSGWISADQTSPATKTVAVTAGGSIAAGFQFDQAMKVTLLDGLPTTVKKPTTYQVTFMNTYGDMTVTNPLAAGTSLHPFPSGYQAVAGDPNDPAGSNLGCLAPDPANWPVRAADGAVGARPPAATGPPGTTVQGQISWGLVNVGSVSNKYIKAVSEATAPGTDDPGCAQTVTLAYGQLSSSALVIALPYGSWRVYSSSTSGSLGSDLSGLIPGGPFDTVNGKVVTLDPRKVIAP